MVDICEVKKMGCKKYIRIRVKDVGRMGHHYIKIGVKKIRGKKGGRTERIGSLKTYKKMKKLIGV